MTCNVMSCHVTPCHAMSYHVTSCHVISGHIMLCHVVSCGTVSCHVMHVTPCHDISSHVISCHVVPCHVMSCHGILHLQCTKRHQYSINHKTIGLISDVFGLGYSFLLVWLMIEHSAGVFISFPLVVHSHILDHQLCRDCH